MFELRLSAQSGLGFHPSPLIVVACDSQYRSTAALPSETIKQIKRIGQRGDFLADVGDTLLLQDPEGLKSQRLLVVGVGKSTGVNDHQIRKAYRAAAAVVGKLKKVQSLLWWPFYAAEDLAPQLNCAALELGLSAYSLDAKQHSIELSSFEFLVPEEQLDKLEASRAQVAATLVGQSLARRLANLAANLCTPSDLAREALALAKRHSSIKVEVLDKKQLEKLGANTLLAVSQGSAQPPCMIVLRYQGGAKRQAPVALVGKGVTFDAGGISLKPAAEMDEMKMDMSGAASVLGTFEALALMGLEQSVVGVIPACENLPDGKAVKPGDVITSLSGKTIEILNTDAEGRLILADALSYVEQKFKPRLIVDIATLTGACVIALGNVASGLMSNDEALSAQLLAAGQRSGDRTWALPLWEDYQELLQSNFADLPNISGGRGAGTITGACFLSRFVKEGRPWAHLDIAGVAWHSGKNKGATGRPVPLLVEFLKNL